MKKLLVYTLLCTTLVNSSGFAAVDTAIVEQFKEAINKGSIAEVKELVLSNLSKINSTDSLGKTALDYAKAKSPTIAALLEKVGAASGSQASTTAESNGFTSWLESMGLIEKGNAAEIAAKTKVDSSTSKNENSAWQDFLNSLRASDTTKPTTTTATGTSVVDEWIAKGKAYWQDLKNQFQETAKQKAYEYLNQQK